MQLPRLPFRKKNMGTQCVLGLRLDQALQAFLPDHPAGTARSTSPAVKDPMTSTWNSLRGSH